MPRLLIAAFAASATLAIPSFIPSAIPSAMADEAPVVRYDSAAGVEDALFALESAIIDCGLVIDYRSHIGAMLERTGADVGSDETIFEEARIFLFCSAVLSRRMMEAAIDDIAFCPYGVFAYAAPGAEGSVVGYRRVGLGAAEDDPKREIDALLDEIAREAAGVE